MVTKSFASALFFGLILVTGVAVTAPISPAAAQQKISQKLAAPMSAAQTAVKAGKWADALKALQEAEKVPGKSAYEEYIIQEYKGSALTKLGRNGEAARAYEAALATGQMPGAQVPARQKLIATLYARAGSAGKANEFAQKYLKAAPNDSDMLVLVGQTYFQNKDYANAAKYVGQAVDSAERNGRRVDENWLQVLRNAYYNTGNVAGSTQILQKLIRYYPKPAYWSDAALFIQKSGLSEGRNMDLYRLRLATGALQKPQDYIEMAELGLIRKYPGDSKAILDKGFANGVLGKGAANETERTKKLLARATTDAAANLQGLPAAEAAAQAAATGDALVDVGEAYLSHGQFDKAIAALKAGIDKGGLKDEPGAKLRLGAAHVGAKQNDKARQAFTSIATKDAARDIAQLWLLHLR